MAVVYRCSRCGREYSLEQANALAFTCHGSPLERVRVCDKKDRAFQPVPRTCLAGEWVVRRIIPPPQNDVDATGVEQLLGSLSYGDFGPLSLEIAGNARRRQLLVRGRPDTVDHVVHQLQSVYGQVSWEDPGNDDPALLPLSDGLHVESCCLGLRRPPLFPLKTWREFEEADPLRVVLGAFRGLKENEALLAQLVLLRPAPDDWADAYQGAAQYRDFRVQAASPAGQARGGLFALAIVLGFLDMIAFCAAGAALLRPSSGFPDLLKVLGGIALLGVINAGLAVPGVRAWRRLTSLVNANPEAVRRKVSQPAYECELRLWAFAPESERARTMLRRLIAAFRTFNLAEGNALIPVNGRERPLAPYLLSSSSSTPLSPLPLETLERLWKPSARALLNLTEIAGLWHMPVGEVPELVSREEYEKYIPLPEDVGDPDGVFIGWASKGDVTIDVHLSSDAIKRNVFLIGKTQMGKSNVMKLLATHIMQQEGAALVVLDPQGDMVRQLAGLIPPDRAFETCYIDFANPRWCIGLNLLDMSLGVHRDKVISDSISLGKTLWRDYWGPRMEAVWRYAVKTLVLINEQLVAAGMADRQYTILDVPTLLLAPREARLGFLQSNVPVDTPDGQDVLWWWENWYEVLRFSLQQDVISPVITKIFRLSGSSIVRSIFGAPRSTVNLRQKLRDRNILLIHTAAGELGEEEGGFIGAVVLNVLNAVFRERSAEERSQRVSCMVIVDEFQTIPAVDYGALLSELQKFNVAFVLGTQSLARLRAIHRELPGIILGGVATVMAFQLNNEDAEYMTGELDQVPPDSLVGLEPFHAYVKTTNRKGKRIQTYSVHTREAPRPDPAIMARVLAQVHTYSRPVGEDGWQRLDLLGDTPEARRKQEEMAAALQGAKMGDFISPERLQILARMQATRSTQDYSPQAGSIAPGLSTSGRQRRKRGKGFSVEGADAG